MCRGKPFCSELGEDPSAWSREAPLLPPDWFRGQLPIFCEAVRAAEAGDVAAARTLVREVESNRLRDWYVEHGQNSGRFRFLGLGSRPGQVRSDSLDPRRQPGRKLEKLVFMRDGYRCRYCGGALIDAQALQAFEHIVGSDTFRARGTNEQRHGIVLAFRACADHVIDWKHGGRTVEGNLVTACWSCNFGKYFYSLDQLGLDDPRERAPRVDGSWDGLMPKLSNL